MNKILNQVEKIVKKYVVRYVLGLILTKERKLCTNIAKIFSISHDTIRKYLIENTELAAFFPDAMVEIVKHYHKIKPGRLVVDDTALSKIYAKYIEGIHWIYNSSLRRGEKGLCIVVIAWTNGDITIPIAFGWWTSKKVDIKGYKTKIEVAKDLIASISKKTNIKYLLADAAYISQDMIKFLKSIKVKFITRVHSSRKVERNGICEQMRYHKNLRLKGNNRAKIVKVKMSDERVNIVVFKRQVKGTSQYETVFLITNIEASAREIISLYGLRGQIELIFRTMKQFLGLMQCAAIKRVSQQLHIDAVFFSFAFLQYEKLKNNFTCPEDSVRYLQALKIEQVECRFNRFCQDLLMVA